MQRLVAELQRRQQLMVVAQHCSTRRHIGSEGLLRPATRFAQALAQLLEQGTVRFGTVAHLRAQFVTGLLHGQFRGQIVHVAQVEISGHPARQQQHLTGHARGDIGVAVTVTAHPRGEANRRSLQRQTQAGSGLQALIGTAQELRHGLP